MNFLNAYLNGSFVLGDVRPAVVVERGDVGPALAEAERAVADEEAAERRAFAPFEAAVSPGRRLLKSEVPSVSDAAWTDYALAMRTALPTAVSASNALGMFEMRPKRLADLGLCTNLRRERFGKRLVWLADFVPPLTERAFLDSPDLQYQAFCDSTTGYIAGLRDGSVARPEAGFPSNMTLSGALAILHRGGPGALRDWGKTDVRRGRSGGNFDDTVALYQRANGIF